MITSAEQLYEKLKVRLAITGGHLLGLHEIEDHFDACNKTVILLNKLIREKGFTCINEEISFFRDHKPRFTSLQRYYVLLYNHSLFKPDDTSETIQYLERMLQRLDRFVADQHSFYTFCHSGVADTDLKYFARPDKKSTQTIGEVIVSDIMAHQMLAEYIRRELEIIRP